MIRSTPPGALCWSQEAAVGWSEMLGGLVLTLRFTSVVSLTSLTLFIERLPVDPPHQLFSEVSRISLNRLVIIGIVIIIRSFIVL